MTNKTEATRMIDGEICLHCKKSLLSNVITDYEGWKLHEKCAGKYSLQLFLKSGEELHFQGFEDEERVKEFIRDEYPDFKQYTIRKVR